MPLLILAISMVVLAVAGVVVGNRFGFRRYVFVAMAPALIAFVLFVTDLFTGRP